MELTMELVYKIAAQDKEMGALPALYAATFPGLPRGSYIGPDGPKQYRGTVEAIPLAYDEDVARRLWEVSEELTGVRFPTV